MLGPPDTLMHSRQPELTTCRSVRSPGSCVRSGVDALVACLAGTADGRGIGEDDWRTSTEQASIIARAIIALPACLPD